MLNIGDVSKAASPVDSSRLKNVSDYVGENDSQVKSAQSAEASAKEALLLQENKPRRRSKKHKKDEEVEEISLIEETDDSAPTVAEDISNEDLYDETGHQHCQSHLDFTA